MVDDKETKEAEQNVPPPVSYSRARGQQFQLQRGNNGGGALGPPFVVNGAFGASSGANGAFGASSGGGGGSAQAPPAPAPAPAPVPAQLRLFSFLSFCVKVRFPVCFACCA